MIILKRFTQVEQTLTNIFSYFSFLFALTLTSHFLLDSKSFSSIYSNYTYLSFVIQSLFCITYIEFGFIFFSAGLFKILDTRESPISFALGLLNPMWSKIYTCVNFTESNRVFLNWLGPFLQLIAGLFIISTIKIFSIIGFVLIIIMFLSITPFTRLSWLCPAISSLSFYHLININDIKLVNFNFVLLAIFLRSIVYIFIATQYFGDIQNLNNIIFRRLVYLYRKFLGVIIWKVFTFDIVRNLAITKTNLKLNKENLVKINPKKTEALLKLSSKTNVYDSITVSSLIASGDYLDSFTFQKRINHFCKVMGIDKLITLRVGAKIASEKYKDRGPFMNAEIRVLLPQNIDDNEINKEYNFIDYKSKYPKKD